MHTTTAFLDAAEQGPALNLSVQAGDQDTKFFDLQFEDDDEKSRMSKMDLSYCF
jgi:hypothetical protein